MAIRIGVKILNKEAKLPLFAHPGEDAGADVYALPNPARSDGIWRLEPREIAIIPLGFALEIPPHYEVQVRSRSGLSTKGIVVANAPGTIDAGFRNEIKVILVNVGQGAQILYAGDRVAQLVLKEQPVAEYVAIEELSSSQRGMGGLGSTGTS